MNLRRLAASAVLIATSTAAHALTLLDITGTSTFSFGNSAVIVTGWVQTATYFNVAVKAPMVDNSVGGPIAGIEGVVYLVNKIGPGTTPANNVVPPVVVTGLTSSFATRTLFSGLTLPAGIYYVVWVPTNVLPLSMSPEGTLLPTISTSPGVGWFGSAEALAAAPFPPASDFLPPAPPIMITVTGDAAPTAMATPIPTLSAWSLFALAGLLVLLTVFARRHRR